MTAEQVGGIIMMLALVNALLIWVSLKRELYQRLLFLLGMGLGITGIGLVTLAAKVEEGVTSISDPKLQSAVHIALIGVSLTVIGMSNVFFALIRVIENLRRT